MKVRYGTLLLISMTMILIQWGCKNNNNIVGTGVPVTAIISGTVTPSNSTIPINGAWVVLSYGNTKDSIETDNTGTFSFSISIASTDTSQGVDATLTSYASGYVTWTDNINVKANLTIPISLLINSKQYAIVNGSVQDSVSKYPIAGASVVISVSGSSSSMTKLLSHIKSPVKSVSSYTIDTTTTLLDGSFVLNIDLFTLDILSATMTVTKAGFLPYQIVLTFKSNTTTAITVPLQQDKSQTVAHIVGEVTDKLSGLPVTSVLVTLTSTSKKDSVVTLNDGSYSFDLNLSATTSSASGTLLFHLNSYDDTTINFSVNAGQTQTYNMALSAKPTVVGGDSNTGRGIAQSFFLMSGYPQPNEILNTRCWGNGNKFDLMASVR